MRGGERGTRTNFGLYVTNVCPWKEIEMKFFKIIRNVAVSSLDQDNVMTLLLDEQNFRTQGGD